MPDVNEGGGVAPEDKPEKKKIVIEGLENASIEQLRAEADKLDKEVDEVDESILKKKHRARMIRLKMRELSEDCDCATFTKLRGDGRRVVLECDQCKMRYTARMGG